MNDWHALDRSDWPLIQSPDFGGVDLDGNPVMVAVCPDCGLYRDCDDSPDDHLDDWGPCAWVAAHNGYSAPEGPDGG